MNAVVRPERPEDNIAIGEVLRAAFPSDQEARLVERLRQHNDLSISLVAEVDGIIAGHIAFSPVTFEGAVSESVGFGLAPLAVRPELQRHGIGAQLVHEGLRACERSGVGFVVVLGEPEYYRPFGFREAGAFGIDNAYGADESFMILPLKPGSLVSGLIRYSPDFSELAS